MSESNLPQGWAFVPLGELGEWSGGGTPSKSNSSFWSNGSIPWVSPKDMKVPVISSSIDYITEAAVRGSATKLIGPGSILFVTRSGILAHTFPVARTAVAVTVNQDIKALTPAPPFDPDYVAWCARAYGWTILNQCSKDGTTVASVDTSRLHDFPFPIAPEREQHRIVEAIESYFTRLDDAVATLERVQRNLKRYRASVLKAAVEGRLVPTEAELARAEGRSYEPASVLLERILAERRRRWEEAELAKMKAKGKAPKDDGWKARYVEPVAPDTAELPDVPEGWCWATADQVFWFVTSGSRGWAKYYGASGSVFVRIGNLDHDTISLDLTDIQYVQPPEGAEGTRTRVQPGDVLISITADVGMIGLARDGIDDAYINQHVSLGRPVSCIDRPFLAWFLASPEGGQRQFHELQRGATKVGLGLDDIRNVNVPLPPLEEQRRIADEVERRMSIAFASEHALRAATARVTRLRQSILKWAFEGRLVDQDPTDEPAAALLERIHAERHSAGGQSPKARGRRNKRAPKA
jgi:type I restriction enzyme S subunit